MTIGKNLLNSNISSFVNPHNMVNVGPLTAEIDCRVWGTLANFNRFRVLASLLYRSRSTEVNQTLHDVWPSPGLVHTFVGFCPLTEFCQVQNSICVRVFLRSPILAALLHGILRSCFQLQLLLFQTPIFGRVAITWHFHATSSSYCITREHSAERMSAYPATSHVVTGYQQMR